MNQFQVIEDDDVHESLLTTQDDDFWMKGREWGTENDKLRHLWSPFFSLTGEAKVVGGPTVSTLTSPNAVVALLYPLAHLPATPGSAPPRRACGLRVSVRVATPILLAAPLPCFARRQQLLASVSALQ